MRRYPVLIVSLLFSTLLWAEETVSSQDIYTQQCSRCHKLPDASSRTFSQWQLIIDVMQHIIQIKGESPLSDAEKQQVLAHLQQRARQENTEEKNHGADVFVARCTLCHQRPEPDMLTPMQWKMIMRLMQVRMQQAGVPQLNEQEFELVQSYLIEQANQ